MTDDELLTAFENCSLPMEQWNHRAHVRVAYLYASRMDLEEATNSMRMGIKAYNQATETPESVDRGYHETMTVAFMRLVYTASRNGESELTSEQFCEAQTDLLDKKVMLKYYTRQRIMTLEAKREFVEPDLCPLPEVSTAACDDAQYRVVEELTEDQIVQLNDLIQQQWWGHKRSLAEVYTMVENTSLMIGLVDQRTNQLVGYCRMLTDYTFRATIYDVMVDKTHQGIGLGKRLLDTICSHPKIQDVNFIYLACEPPLFDFYKRWGFKEYDGRAEWMIKVQHDE